MQRQRWQQLAPVRYANRVGTIDSILHAKTWNVLQVAGMVGMGAAIATMFKPHWSPVSGEERDVYLVRSVMCICDVYLMRSVMC
jgi:hypothetical protein